jgi:hypothetical protein
MNGEHGCRPGLHLVAVRRCNRNFCEAKMSSRLFIDRRLAVAREADPTKRREETIRHGANAVESTQLTQSNVYWVAQIIRAAQTAAGRLITLRKTQAISR